MERRQVLARMIVGIGQLRDAEMFGRVSVPLKMPG
jgi:hypothetical protein